MNQPASSQPRTSPPGTTDASAPGRAGTDPVVIHGSDVRVERANYDLPVAEAKHRYGGVDVLAVIGGALAGLGAAAVLGGLATAFGLEVGQGDGDALAVAALVTALVVVALSALVAGWVAGRAARFDGARNGLLAGLLMALLLALLGAAGAYSAADGGLPVSFDGDLTTPAIIAAVAALVVSLLAGMLGGRIGAKWHRSVDDVVVGTRLGAVGRPGQSETSSQVVR